jgi:hypothetical protein
MSSLGAPVLPDGLLLLAAARHHLGAADQDARIDPERVADNAEHHDGADAEPATAHAHGQAEAAATAARAIAAAIFDILAFGHIIETHRLLLAPTALCAGRFVQVH